MKVVNQTGSTMTIQGEAIEAGLFYAVPTEDQLDWAKDPALRAAIYLGNVALTWRDPADNEFVASATEAIRTLAAIVNGEITPQAPLADPP